MTMDMKTDFNDYEVLPKWGLSLSARTEEASFRQVRASVFAAAHVLFHDCAPLSFNTLLLVPRGKSHMPVPA